MGTIKQRPEVPTTHVNEVEHRRLLADQVNAAIPKISTWTPVLKFGGATTGITYTTQIGESLYYGDFAYEAWFHIVLSSKGSATGAATITGLEEENGMTIKSTSGDLSIENIAGGGAKADVRLIVEPGESEAALEYGAGGSTGVGTAFEDSDLNNTTEIFGRISYRL